MSLSSKSLKECLSNLVKEAHADYLYLPSFDHNLCEYVPRDDSLRIFITKFSGSVAEALVSKEGKIHLFVDGRYHEQADLECDPDLVVVEKVAYGTSLRSELLKKLKSKDKLAIIGERTPFALLSDVNGVKEENFISLEEGKTFDELGFRAPQYAGPLWQVTNINKDKFQSRSRECLNSSGEEVAFINALDTLSWVSGLRGSHLPYQGTFRGRAIMTLGELHIFVSKQQLEAAKEWGTVWRFFYESSEFDKIVRDLVKDKVVLLDERFSTLKNYWQLKSMVGESKLVRHSGYHAAWQAIKDETEIQFFRDSFEKSDKAIYEGLCHLIDHTRSGLAVTEKSFRDDVEKSYRKQGAKLQSFRTISGFGANSSIIHFGSPSDQKRLEEGELVLLDSGAIYEEGFATDCTRTIIPLGKPSKEQKLHYTLVLKGLVKVLMATFKVGTLGKELDELARGPLKAHGLNFSHGTGHGVGVNVHEAGYSITPFSEVPMTAGLVGSVEPGFYVPGVGGIRLENIVVVKKVAPDLLGFECLVHIGFWSDLIERNLLSQEEIDYLEGYEASCLDKGRSFSRYASDQLEK